LYSLLYSYTIKAHLCYLTKDVKCKFDFRKIRGFLFHEKEEKRKILKK